MNKALRRVFALSCAVALLMPFAVAARENPHSVRQHLLNITGQKDLPAVVAVKGKEVGSIGCTMDMDLNYKPIQHIPIIDRLIGIGEEINGTATVHCAGHDPARYTVSGGGLAPALIPVAGSKSYRGLAIRLPAPFLPANVEGDYVYVGVSSIIGGVQVSPWINRSVEFRVEIQLPFESSSLVGVNITKLTFRRS